mmetsp:Transcript_22986/g.48654  ORF Transcript_22986/g.48654 Transcript_22986/m.48654 type:complete len:225 (+) Transcript_22986:443-1117(+)
MKDGSLMTLASSRRRAMATTESSSLSSSSSSSSNSSSSPTEPPLFPRPPPPSTPFFPKGFGRSSGRLVDLKMTMYLSLFLVLAMGMCLFFPPEGPPVRPTDKSNCETHMENKHSLVSRFMGLAIALRREVLRLVPCNLGPCAFASPAAASTGAADVPSSAASKSSHPSLSKTFPVRASTFPSPATIIPPMDRESTRCFAEIRQVISPTAVSSAGSDNCTVEGGT